MTNSDDSTGFRGGNPGAPADEHARTHDPRYGKPGAARQRADDPRVPLGNYYPGQTPATAGYPSAYPEGAASPGAHRGDRTHADSYPATPSPASHYRAPPATDYRADSSAGYPTSADYSAAAGNAGGQYSGGQPEPPSYPEYRQPTPPTPGHSDYQPATHYGNAAAGDAGDHRAAMYGTAREPAASAYDRNPAYNSYSGARGSHSSYTTEQPAAAGNYHYPEPTPEPASAYGNSRGGLDTGYEEPAGRESYNRDYESPFDSYAGAAAGNYEQSGYPDPGHGDVYFEGEHQGDADFYDGAYGDDYAEEPSRHKRTLLVAGALCGALIVGGGVAYAYKNDFFGLIGDDRLAGSPPLIQADKSPAKIKPANTESKNADNGGKLIYDRLQSPGEADAAAPEERVVARQESVLDTSSIAARLGDDKPDASSAASPTMTGAMMKKEAGSPSSEPESQPAGQMDKAGGMTGPRKVKTYQVKPDGTLMKPASPPEAVATQPEPAVPANISTASIDASAAAPVAALPKPKPEAKRTAALAAPVTAPAVTPANSAASASTQFAVQIAARRTQTDALATFANLQQKFPELLTPYQPLIQKADLGNKGTWYRLRVGPLNDKPSASDLCSKLKTAGLKGCLVRPL